MCGISFVIFLIAAIVFIVIMARDPRTLWSGFSLFWMLVCFALFSFFVLSQYADQLAEHDWLMGVLAFLFIAAVLCACAFPGLLIAVFFIEGIKVIQHEGAKPSNLLSMLFAILLYCYLVIWPKIENLAENTFGTTLYAIVGAAVVYILSLMSIYTLSAILNLIHLKKNRGADYIMVLGCGVIGTRVPPLLAARIEKGMELLRYNPGAVLILSGGQGPGEAVSESEAMTAYAVEKGVDKKKILMETKSVSTQENLLFSRQLMVGEKPKIILVTTSYHVFRALLLARKQGIKCVGFGAKTKWYFTLNAMLREFVGYLQLTWKKHAFAIGIASGIIVVSKFIGWLKLANYM